MTTSTLPRPQDEIVARLEAIKPDDFFGFKAEILASSLDFEHAKPYLKEGVEASEWNPTLDADKLREEAFDYLEFAFGKAEDHRGLSASRSIDKLTEYAWLLGRDEIVAAMDAAGYAQYGVPKLVAFAEGFERPILESEDLRRMSRGERCTATYNCGCGY